MTDAPRTPPAPAPQQIVAAVRRGEQGEVYKQDRRSRVWRIDLDQAPAVVKRFEHSPPRQLAAWLLGMHPAQVERRANRRLTRDGIAVVPIAAHGVVAAGLGLKAWLATPWAGRPLVTLLAERPSGPHRRALAVAVGRLAGVLIALGWFFKDLKTSNILVDEAGAVRLIDVGSARRRWTRGQAIRMLVMLDRTAERDGASRADRLRALRAALSEAPALGPMKQVAREVLDRHAF